MDYEHEMDKIFATHGYATWEHRTLRTLFDPASQEWTETSMDEKVGILKKIVEAKVDLWVLILKYQERYSEQNRKDIANDALMGVSMLLQHVLKV